MGCHGPNAGGEFDPAMAGHECVNLKGIASHPWGKPSHGSMRSSRFVPLAGWVLRSHTSSLKKLRTLRRDVTHAPLRTQPTQGVGVFSPPTGIAVALCRTTRRIYPVLTRGGWGSSSAHQKNVAMPSAFLSLAFGRDDLSQRVRARKRVAFRLRPGLTY